MTAILVVLSAVIATPRNAEADTDGTTSVTGDSSLVTFNLPVRVNVSGLPDDWSGFSFKVTMSADESTQNAPTPTPADVTVTSSASTQFGQTWAIEPGTYVYDIVQTAGDNSQMTYDTTTHKVTVTVTEDADGNLVATYPAMTTIENTYQPDSVMTMGNPIVCKAQLEHSGYAYPSNFFTYVLKAIGDDATDSSMLMSNGIYGASTQTVTPQTLSATTPTTISFGDMYVLTEAGTHYFEIYAQVPDSATDAATANEQFKTNPLYVRLQVNETPEGVLSYTIEYGDSLDGPWTTEPVTLYNGYEASGYAWGSGTVASFDDIYFDVTKMLKGRDSQSDEAYTFTITALDATLPDGTVVAADGNAEDISNGFLFGKNASGLVTQTVSVSDLTDGVAKTVKFEKPYEFYNAGTFRFKVVENIPLPGAEGMTYDTTVHYITVTATLRDNGTTDCVVTYEDESAGATAATFTNTYTAPASSDDKKTDLPSTGTTTDDKDKTTGTTDDNKTDTSSTTTDKSADATSGGNAGSTTDDKKSDASSTTDDDKTGKASSDKNDASKTDVSKKVAISKKASTSKKAASSTTLPKTGDATQAWIPVVIAVAGVAVVVVAIALVKKTRAER
jgi:pilin isopeptide linkage protein/LPXTG-motif cell wall-anchored protein